MSKSGNEGHGCTGIAAILASFVAALRRLLKGEYLHRLAK